MRETVILKCDDVISACKIIFFSNFWTLSDLSLDSGFENVTLRTHLSPLRMHVDQFFEFFNEKLMMF